MSCNYNRGNLGSLGSKGHFCFAFFFFMMGHQYSLIYSSQFLFTESSIFQTFHRLLQWIGSTASNMFNSICYTIRVLFHCVLNLIFNIILCISQGYYPDIYSAQEKWQEAGQKFRVLLIDWHMKFHLTCIVWSLPT